MIYEINIGWLYPELMSTYGDKGNILCLKNRCLWRNIKVNIYKLELGFDKLQLAKCDFLFMGGAQDRQQKIIENDLFKKRHEFVKLINSGLPGLYICGAYQFLGRFYKNKTGHIIKGLGIFDMHTESPRNSNSRLIGNIIIEPIYNEFEGNIMKIVGFENHSGRTYLGKNIKPFGKVIFGFGNNGHDQTEGGVFKNSFGSYLHGPILPKNPQFADFLIKLTIQNKYQKKIKLVNINDTIEKRARETVGKKLGVKV